MEKVKVGPLGRITWTDEMNDYFKRIVPGHTGKEIKWLFKKRYDVVLSDSAISNRKIFLGVKSGVPGGRFKPGHVPHNKGVPQKQWINPGKTKNTRFKKGNLPHTAKPLGVERISPDGYIEVHVAERPTKSNDNWKAKHRLVYEEHFGEIPPSHNVVFADGNKRNFDPQNLVAVPRGCWAIINNHNIPYHDRESLLIAIDIAKLKKASNKAEKHPRSCKKCGVEFAPRYSRQKTCDVCLGRVNE